MLSTHSVTDRAGPVLITGGAGFIGTNLAARLLRAGRQVVVFDNLSRRGVENNIQFLRRKFPERLRFIQADIRDRGAVESAVVGVSQLYHFAAQVAVTTSLDDPIHDFEVNARGALNLLEALRKYNRSVPLVFTSTNKVYGHLDDIALVERGGRYCPVDAALAQHGISESRSIHFHSPYGCSKGAADQYVLDYARTFGLKAAVFRMSCIYGPHQCGNEDQGWIAHFIDRALKGETITLFGDGRQVRDVLFVEDLVDAFLRVQELMGEASGRVFNIGGGPENAISLLDLLVLISQFKGAAADVDFQAWRLADQRYYVSDTRQFAALAGWRPRVSAPEGVRRLYHWMRENRPAPISAIPAAEEVGLAGSEKQAPIFTT